MIKDYIEQNDWRVKENSNSTYSFSGLLQYLATSEIAKHMLDNVYPKYISKAHIKGDLHIHDLGYGIAPYCCGWSLEDLIREGLNGVPGKVQSGSAKHLSTLIIQMVNFLGCVQMESAGAQAFNSVDLFLAPFVKVDKLNYFEVKQNIQQLVFSLNIPSRWGSQAPFTNFTFDLTVPKDKKDQPCLIGGEVMQFTYGDCQKEVDMINMAFLEVMMKGDYKNAIFNFPIPTYNITTDFDYSSPVAELLWKATAKYGIPYFSNFVNSDMKPEDVRSMCCRLRLDLTKLEKRHGGLFGAGDKTGSIGVVTINLPRIGFRANNLEEYFEDLDDLLEIAKESLDIKREVITTNLENGMFPYIKRYLPQEFKNHFSTIGIIGMYESLLNLNGTRLYEPEGVKLANKIIDHINEKLVEFQVTTPDVMYNLEATPAEGTSYRLAKTDKLNFPDIITSGTHLSPYYTNSVHLPVDYSNNIFKVLSIEDEMQTKFTSGTVIHGFVGEEISNTEVVKSIVKKVCTNYKLPYFTITPTFSICQDHNYIPGKVPICPICGKETLVYSRIVGYYSPTNNWNIGKAQEFTEREVYDFDESNV